MRRTEPRPTGVTLIAVYQFVTALVMLLATCAVLVFLTPAMLFTANAPSEALGGLVFVLLLFGFFLAFAIGSAVVGWGLLLQEPWSRIGAMALAIPALLGFPIWTVAGILVLAYLASGEGRAAFGQPRAAAEAPPLTAVGPAAPPPPAPATHHEAAVSVDPAAPAGAEHSAQETREVRPEDGTRQDGTPPGA